MSQALPGGRLISLALGLLVASCGGEPAEGPLRTISEPIYGGQALSSCAWPAVVSLGGFCSGVLVHPELVVYAAHCGTNFVTVGFGADARAPERTVPVDYCYTYADARFGEGNDLGFCVLAEPQRDVSPARVIAGCELAALRAGLPVYVAGFGEDENGASGTKKLASATLASVGREYVVSSSDHGTCGGDSGGPLLLQLSDLDPAMGNGYRVVGVNSYGKVAGCGTAPSYFTPLGPFVAWLESTSDRDLSPCFDASGTWAPTPGCLEESAPIDRLGCDPGGRVWAQSCGTSYAAPAADAPPTIRLVAPPEASLHLAKGQVFAELSLEARVSASANSGVREVEFEVSSGDVQASYRDEVEPYRIPTLRLRAGRWRVRAVARDHLGNASEDRLELEVHATPTRGCSIPPGGHSPRRSLAHGLLVLLAVALVRRLRDRLPTNSDARRRVA